MDNPVFNTQTEADDYNDSDERIVIDVPQEFAGGRIDAVLARLLPDFSRSRLAKWITDGKVLLDGNTVTPKTKVWGGEVIEVSAEPDPADHSFAAEPVDFPVIYEDAAIIVIDKPAGLVVHPAAGNWQGTLLNGLLYRYPELAHVPRAGIVHRLDKDTSGLMVVARTLTAQIDLVRQLQAQTVKRQYLAIAQGRLKGEGTINAPVGRHARDRLRMAVVPGGKPAVTHWRVIEPFARYTLVQCQLETGRTHQIRVHMAHLGHSLAADPVYSNRMASVSTELTNALAVFKRQALHALRLAVVHPLTGETMQWESQIPEDFQTLLDAIRNET